MKIFRLWRVEGSSRWRRFRFMATIDRNTLKQFYDGIFDIEDRAVTLMQWIKGEW